MNPGDRAAAPARPAHWRLRLARRLPRLAASVAFIYVSVCAAMFLLQDRLLFPGAPDAPDLRARADRFERVSLSPEPGVTLQGVLLKTRDPEARSPLLSETRSPLLIYFGGNGEEATWWAQADEWPAGWRVLLLNYRGYGTSTGSPSEAALHADARFVYERMAARPDVDPDRIVALGRSLGSGVATRLASEKKLAGIVLVTPYDSVISVAQSFYPWLPVRWLLRHRFDSLALAPRIATPMLMIVTPEDHLVPVAHSERLHAAWAGSKSIVRVEGTDHGGIAGEPEYWRAIERFLRPLAAATPEVPKSNASRANP